jgi:hypothetical protein
MRYTLSLFVETFQFLIFCLQQALSGSVAQFRVPNSTGNSLQLGEITVYNIPISGY